MDTIPRMTVVTLGVADLLRSAQFYQHITGVAPNAEHEGVRFFTLAGVWLSLFPLVELAKDISPDLKPQRGPMSGITLAYNARSVEEVLAIFQRVAVAGGQIVKPPQQAFWGGFSGYFCDPDGYHWEVVWGDMFSFSEQGDLQFKTV